MLVCVFSVFCLWVWVGLCLFRGVGVKVVFLLGLVVFLGVLYKKKKKKKKKRKKKILKSVPYLQVSVHESLAVDEIHGLCDLQEDCETLPVLPELGLRALGHPVFQVLLSAQLHLDVQVDFRCEGRPSSGGGRTGRQYQRRGPRGRGRGGA